MKFSVSLFPLSIKYYALSSYVYIVYYFLWLLFASFIDSVIVQETHETEDDLTHLTDFD